MRRLQPFQLRQISSQGNSWLLLDISIIDQRNVNSSLSRYIATALTIDAIATVVAIVAIVIVAHMVH
ncbi:hypothetical protein D3C80_1710350 [compost metagenome]